MASTSEARSTQVPRVVIEANQRLLNLELRPVWEYRELLLFLIWREVSVRYKQTLIGATWVILQPLLTALIYAVIFGTLIKVPSDGIPYVIFAFSALVPWRYFSSAIERSSASLIVNVNLLTKVYFPRLIIPISAVAVPLVDIALSMLILIGMMMLAGIMPTWRVLVLPVFLAMAVLSALAAGLWLSALNVRYRDVTQLVPFGVQILMYLSPVVYPMALVPEHWRWLYSLNPMVGVIEGFRWALLGTNYLNPVSLVASLGAVLVLLVSGLFYFRRVEDTFADVI
jgi:lipopolysaccharide transport system permease protein